MDMDYYATFKTEAAKTIKPLADSVRRLEKELERLRAQLTKEQGNAASFKQRLDTLKSLAGEKLTAGQNAYEKYRRDHRRLAGELGTSQAMVESFTDELIPAKERELSEARNKVQAALGDLAVAKRPVCEDCMAELLGQVLDERDSFVAAFDSLFGEYGGDFTGYHRVYPDGLHYRPDPSRADFLIATGLDENSVNSKSIRNRRGDYLTPPQEAAEAASSPQAAQAQNASDRRESDGQSPDSTIAGQDGTDAAEAGSPVLRAGNEPGDGTEAVAVDSPQGRANLLGH